jgi:hypothetical protein
MKRIYPDFTYGDGPKSGCWWDKTCQLPDYPSVDADTKCDVAID